MTEADLQRVESAIGRPFPAAVRHFFLHFPPGLRIPDEERDPDFSISNSLTMPTRSLK